MPISLSNKKKMRNALFVVLLIFILLTVRLAYIQFVWGVELSEKAGTQQSQSRTITAKRGTIYDSTGKYILAESSSVESVSVNPTNISDENKEKVAKALSDIFELDYDKILKKDGILEFKTDNRPLFDFSLEEMEAAGWHLDACTYDLHQDELLNRNNILTEYVEKFSSMGNPICKMVISR